MDYIVIDLLNACDLVLNRCKRSDNIWAFEEGSEAHLALVDAVKQARLALGIDRSNLNCAPPKDITFPAEKIN